MSASADRLPALLDELREVLDEERHALLGGSAERIVAVTRRKLALADTIEEVVAAGAPAPSLEMLARLARYNRENAVICAAMLRHLTAALDRLRRPDLHRSYNADGSEQRPPARHALGAA